MHWIFIDKIFNFNMLKKSQANWSDGIALTFCAVSMLLLLSVEAEPVMATWHSCRDLCRLVKDHCRRWLPLGSAAINTGYYSNCDAWTAEIQRRLCVCPKSSLLSYGGSSAKGGNKFADQFLN